MHTDASISSLGTLPLITHNAVSEVHNTSQGYRGLACRCFCRCVAVGCLDRIPWSSLRCHTAEGWMNRAVSNWKSDKLQFVIVPAKARQRGVCRTSRFRHR